MERFDSAGGNDTHGTIGLFERKLFKDLNFKMFLIITASRIVIAQHSYALTYKFNFLH